MKKMGVGFRILNICGEIVDSEKTTVFVKTLNSFKILFTCQWRIHVDTHPSPSWNLTFIFEFRSYGDPVQWSKDLNLLPNENFANFLLNTKAKSKSIMVLKCLGPLCEVQPKIKAMRQFKVDPVLKIDPWIQNTGSETCLVSNTIEYKVKIIIE